MTLRERTRTQLRSAADLGEALDEGRPVRIVLHREDDLSSETVSALQRAREAGIDVRPLSQNQLTRLSQGDGPPELLAMVGPELLRDLDAMFADAHANGRAVWLLVDTAYPGNAGFVIRTAEVSGAAGVVVSARFDHEQRRAVRRTAMRADRYMPVHYVEAGEAITAARANGLRVIAIEDCGDAAPWERDLSGSVLFVIGGERDGIPPAVLDACDLVLRLPMDGFVPSYNLQAAMAMVVGERLRQLAAEAGRPGPGKSATS